MKTLKFGDKFIGDGHPTFITFEAGPTHNGFESASELIRAAAASGADAIKFQIFDPDELVADKNLKYSYDVLIDRVTGKTERVEENLYDIFVRRSLTREQWKALKNLSDDMGLLFFATIGDDLGLEIVRELRCDSIKVASADVNHLPWLRKIAKLDSSIQLDTGNATFGEIEQAIDVIRAEGNEKIIIHNCPNGYPAHLDSINLKMLPTLKSVFECPVAYSDHTPGELMDIAAIALGANLIEKTITQDRTTRSVEHIMSLELNETKTFVSNIRALEKAMGRPRRIMSEVEKKNRLNVRRSVIIYQYATKGQLLSEVNVKFKRPGFGVSPDIYETLLEKKLNTDLIPGTELKLEHLD